MEPNKQIEVQLGHMCNNRCVFCVSGQETALGRARPMDIAPIIAEITKAHNEGHRKLTLLGGEPTLQPGFMTVVKHAVALGFDDIVIFTNGVKTAREEFLDEILATKGHFIWRISIQGATKEAHERTTRKDGSFDRIVQTMATLQQKGEHITINMCVVQSNYESVREFPKLVKKYGARQLHLDMIRPLDAGARSEEELRAMIPRYSDMVPALTQMIEGFGDGFDVNIGNLPYCIAPHLARWIHHDGEKTLTIAVDNENTFSKPWDKYLTKRRDKNKPPSCKTCVFESRCSGVFDAYQHFYGTDELTPITAEKLREVDPTHHLLALHMRPIIAGIVNMVPPAPFEKVTVIETGDNELTVTLQGPEPLVIVLRPPNETGFAGFDLTSLHIRQIPRDRALARVGLKTLWGALTSTSLRVIHAMGEDTLNLLPRSVSQRIARLRQKAPFGDLQWLDVQITQDGHRAEVLFEGPAGEKITVWFSEKNGKPTGGYFIAPQEPTKAVVDGLRAVMGALRSNEPASVQSYG